MTWPSTNLLWLFWWIYQLFQPGASLFLYHCAPYRPNIQLQPIYCLYLYLIPLGCRSPLLPSLFLRGFCIILQVRCGPVRRAQKEQSTVFAWCIQGCQSVHSKTVRENSLQNSQQPSWLTWKVRVRPAHPAWTPWQARRLVLIRWTSRIPSRQQGWNRDPRRLLAPPRFWIRFLHILLCGWLWCAMVCSDWLFHRGFRAWKTRIRDTPWLKWSSLTPRTWPLNYTSNRLNLLHFRENRGWFAYHDRFWNFICWRNHFFTTVGRRKHTEFVILGCQTLGNPPGTWPASLILRP